ncbi:MAG: hypothetical protein ACRD2W_24940 [Acidimicrobiales bacterium]
MWTTSLATGARPDWRDGRPLLEEAVGLYRSLGDHYATARALTDLSVLASRDHDWMACRALLTEAAGIQRALGDLRGLTISIAGLGEVARRSAEPDEARARLEEALAIDRELRNPPQVTRELTWLGFLAWMQRDHAEARRRFQEATAVARPLAVKWIFRNAVEGLAGLALVEGDVAEARRLFDEMEALAEQTNDLRPGTPWRFIVLAMLALAEGDWGEATRQCRRAFEGSATTPHRPSETFGMILDVLAALTAGAGDEEQAARLVGVADTSRDDPFAPFRSAAFFSPALAAARACPAACTEGAALDLEGADTLARTALDDLERRTAPTT